ncbi:MAG: LysM peptidoglycan-binding domain-containing protein [Desulfovibrionaceae bacterium]
MKGAKMWGLQQKYNVSLPLLWVVLTFSLLAGGCGSKQNTPTDPLQRMSTGEGTYGSVDDGVVLTSTEIAVLHSTGQVDKKVSEKGMEDVVVQYKHFVRKGRPTVERASRRAEKYLEHSRKAFRDRGMPEELAYLAIVESGYNPTATSPAGAAGAWQFMPFTGTRFGLTQDWWMDERRDPYKSAEAAAEYLKKLHADFNDWHLAIAAYNAGEGKIGRALDKTGAVSFFKLTEKNHTLDDKAQLREETKQYVPRFLAICKIMRNLEKLGFTPIDSKRAEGVVRLEVRPGTDLMALSKAAGMEWLEFHSYNAAYKRYVSPTDRSTLVYIPQSHQHAALAYLKNPRATGYAGWHQYTVGKGDTWQRISQRSSVPVTVLQSANKSMGNLKPGTVVLLPGSDALRTPPGTPLTVPITMAANSSSSRNSGKSASNVDREGDKVSKPSRQNAPQAVAISGRIVTPSTYTMQAGDSLSRVANLYNVSVQDLLACNEMEDANRIRQGQVLRLPSKSGVKASAAASSPASSTVAKKDQVQGASGSLGRGTQKVVKKKQATYVVQAGDTLWGIARKYNVQAKDLLTWNHSDGKKPLRPGDTLVVASDN